MITTDKSPALHHDFPVDAPVEVSVRLGHGSATVHADEGVTNATVELIPRSGDAEQITVECTGRVLTVHAPRQGGVFERFADRRRDLDVDAVIRVPAGSALRVATFTADITATGRTGDSDISTGSAAIELEHVDGVLRLRSGAASARVGVVTGSVTVRSGAGDVHVHEIGGDLIFASATGRAEVDSVRGRVRIRSGAGRIRLGAVYSDAELVTASGAMSIGIPAGVAAHLDVVTGHGSVRSDLEVRDTPAEDATRIRVRARTGAGDIHLHRAG